MIMGKMSGKKERRNKVSDISRKDRIVLPEMEAAVETLVELIREGRKNNNSVAPGFSYDTLDFTIQKLQLAYRYGKGL